MLGGFFILGIAVVLIGIARLVSASDDDDDYDGYGVVEELEEETEDEE